MKNVFKKLFLLLALGVFLGIFSACGENPEVSFKQNSYRVLVGVEIEVGDFLEYSGIEIGDIKLISSNPETVYVKPNNNLVSIGIGSAVITAEGFSGSMIEIEVYDLGINFECPTNLMYDENFGELTWDTVYLENVVATEYEVKLTTGTGNLAITKTYQTNTNSLTINKEGAITASVRALAKSGINSSEYSSEYSFTILGAPSNVVFNDNTKKLEWTADSSISKFKVSVNGLLTEVVGRGMSLELANVGEYTIEVSSYSPNENVFGKKSSDVLVLTRQAAPNLSIIDGQIVWTNTNGTNGYHVSVSGHAIKVFNIVDNLSTSCTYAFNDMSAGEYNLAVYAMGESDNGKYDKGNHTLQSPTSTLSGVIKLPAPTIDFIKADCKINIVGVDVSSNQLIELTAFKNGMANSINFITNGEKSFVLDAGIYSFKAVRVANKSKEVNSNESNEIMVYKFANAKNVRQAILEGNVNNQSEPIHAIGYEVDYTMATTMYSVQYHNTTTQEDVSISGGNYSIDNVFANAGVYNFTITASQSDELAGSVKKYYISSSTTPNLTITRLADLVLVNDVDNNQIKWGEIDGSNIVYTYELMLGDDVVDEGNTANTFFAYPNQVGTYTLKVFAQYGIDQDENNIVLKSLNVSEITFDVEKVLEAPTLNFVKEGNKYYLTVEKDECAQDYVLQINGNYTDLVFDIQNNRYDVTNSLLEGSEWLFEVTACTNGYYLQSDSADLLVTKLVAPQSVNVGSDESLSVNDEIPLGASEAIINVKPLGETDYLQDASLNEDISSFSVRAKFVAELEKVDDRYYIDSDYFEFVLNREVVVLGFDVDESRITFSGDNSENFDKIIYYADGENNPISQINVLEEYVNFADVLMTDGLSINDGIKIGIKYSIKDDLTISAEDVVNEYFISSVKTFGLNIISASARSIVCAEENSNLVAQLSMTVMGATYENNSQYVGKVGEKLVADLSEFVAGSEVGFVIKETMADQTINVLYFSAEKLGNVNELAIEQEVLSYDVPEIAGGISLKINGLEISATNTLADALNSGNVSVIARLIGKQIDNKVYLSSDNTTFNIERLCNYDTLFANAITIDSDLITIQKEDDAAIIYAIKFVGDDDEFEMEYPVSSLDALEIDIKNDGLMEVINSLGDSKWFYIKKLTNKSSVIAGEETNYLDSIYSSAIRIKMLSAPTNLALAVVGDADIQSEIEISWQYSQIEVDAGFEIDHYMLSFTLNNEYFGYEETTTTSMAIDELSAYLNEYGKWGISVQAVGKNDTISSVPCEEVYINRLNRSSKIEISKTGLISFVKVDNASGYILEINYVAETTYNNSVELTQEQNSYQLSQQELEQAYNGEIIVTLYAKGDGATYLTSKTITEFQRLAVPDVELTNNLIKVFNYDDKTIIYYVATIGGVIVADGVLSGEVNAGGTLEAEYPKEYAYDDNGVKVLVNFDTNKQIDFTFYSSHKQGAALDSNTITKQATKLSNYDLIGFKRDLVDDDITHLYVQNNDVLFGKTYISVLNVDGADRVFVAGGELEAAGGIIDAEIDETILSKISNNWQVEYFAVGGTIGDNVYIDSQIRSISGTKLATVSGITTNQGKLVWDSISGVLKYGVYKNGEKYSEEAICEEAFTGLEASEYVIQVRAYGNINNEDYITENIVLDSSLQKTGATIKKIQQIENVNSRLGFIVFDEIDESGKYMLVLYSDLESNPINEYELEKLEFSNENETFGYYFNSTLRQKLSDGNTYYAKFYFKATNEFDISSDVSLIDVGGEIEDYIKICQFSTDANSITLSNPVDEGVIVYSITNALFEMDPNASNGYLLKLDDEIEYKESADNLFRLDEEGDWAVGQHRLAYTQMGSTGIDAERTIYLTPDFGEETLVTKLSNVELKLAQLQSPSQMLINYSSVSGADAYYVYYGNSKTVEKNSSGYIYPEEFSVGNYDSFSVRPINKHSVNVIAGNRIYLTTTIWFPDSLLPERVNLKIKKSNAPDEMIQKDGALMWEMNDLETLIGLIGSGSSESPYFVFFSDGKFSDRKIHITFTNTQTNERYQYQGSAYDFLYITDDLIDSAISCGLFDEEQIEYLKNFQKGFPSRDYNFIDFASTLPPAEYNVSYRILGNEMYSRINILTLQKSVYLLITSDDTTIKQDETAARKYIPGAPTGVEIVNENDEHKLKFKSVNVTSYYSGETVTYALLAEYDDEDGKTKREIISTLNTSEKTDGKPLEFNLTDLVNQSLLEQKHKSLMIYVIGDDGNVLSGKATSLIPITVLDKISAYMEHGEIHIQAQEGATKYVINITGKAEPVEIYSTPGDVEYVWNGDDDLQEGITYSISMFAYGSTSNAVGNIVISGAITNLGNIVKLRKIDTVNAVDGILTWDSISNALAYDIYRASGTAALKKTTTIYLNNYDTTITNADTYRYSFMAIGNDNEYLSSETTMYLNSRISDEYKAKRLDDVKDIEFYDGVVTWKSSLLNESGVRYLIAITASGKEPTLRVVGNDSTVLSVLGSSSKYEDIIGVLAFDASEILGSGTYSVRIQVYYQNTKLDDDDVILLQSYGISKNFEKLVEVFDVEVTDGKIMWTYDGQEDHFYRLTFTSSSENGGTVVKDIEENEFDDVVYNTPNAVSGISLKIQVIPGKISELVSDDYMSSMSILHGVEISQIQRLPDEGVITEVVVDEGNTGNLVVSWRDKMVELVGEANLNLYRYQIRYKYGWDLGGAGEPDDYTVVTQDETSINFESFSENGELYISIRVIPKNDNYISSAWTPERTIAVPKAITGLVYDEETYSFTWDEYSASGTIKYEIIDEIGEYDGIDFVVNKVYKVLASKQDTKYELFETGYHRIKIATIIVNSGSGLLSETETSEIVLFDLFGGGNGTQEDPYIISNETQFGNINYRLNKDNGKDAYFVSVKSEENPNCEIFSTISLGNKFYFKQSDDLFIVSNNITGQFGGVYDGDYYKITLATIFNNGALFNSTNTSAIIKNVEITLGANEIFTTSEFAVLCYTNNGIIENIKVSGDVNIINIENTVMMSYVCDTNNGTIRNVEVTANTTLQSKNDSYITASFAPISVYNNKNIYWVKSSGNITILNFVSNIYASGLTVRSTAGIIENSAFTGDITISVISKGTMVYVGGIIAYAYGQNTITNCYVLGDITIGMSSGIDSLSNANVGGVVGYLTGALIISNSYAKITKNQSTRVGHNTFASIYQLIGLVSASNITATYVYVPNHDENYLNVVGGANTSGLIATLQEYTDINDLTYVGGFVDNSGVMELPWASHLISAGTWKSNQ
ncbi:MAG: hypothetical protein J6T74_04280 [Clostridia bacterium]|nr:hypothetical protein [Clostridia bacterium]